MSVFALRLFLTAATLAVVLVITAAAAQAGSWGTSQPPNPNPTLGKPAAGGYRVRAGSRFYCRLWRVQFMVAGGGVGTLEACQYVGKAAKPTGS